MDFTQTFMKMLGSLAIILGIIICLFYGLKRFRNGSVTSSHQKRMQLLGTLNLAPKRALALVEVCGQWLLIGIGTENVTLISKLEKPTETASVPSGKQGRGRHFFALLQKQTMGHDGQ